MTPRQQKHHATDGASPPLLPALCGLGGALLLPPLVLGLGTALALHIVRFSPLAILSALNLFGRDHYGLIVLILIAIVVILAEIGAFWGFLGGTFVCKLMRTDTATPANPK